MKDMLSKADQHCKSKGWRFTTPRRRVYETLLKSSVPLKAYDVIEEMGDVKPMTVYRALDFLTKVGLTHRLESINAYAVCEVEHCHHTDSQFMICDTCGTIEELHDHALDHNINNAAKSCGFKVSHKALELRGICQKCS